MSVPRLYYRILPEHEDTLITNDKEDFYLIANELYTLNEMVRKKIPIEYAEPVMIQPEKTYFFFGARFSD